MSSLERVRSAQGDLAHLQAALAAVETGLDTAEVAIETVESARRGLRCLVTVALIVLVAAVGLTIVTRRRRRAEEPLPSGLPD